MYKIKIHLQYIQFYIYIYITVLCSFHVSTVSELVIIFIYNILYIIILNDINLYVNDTLK